MYAATSGVLSSADGPEGTFYVLERVVIVNCSTIIGTFTRALKYVFGVPTVLTLKGSSMIVLTRPNEAEVCFDI